MSQKFKAGAAGQAAALPADHKGCRPNTHGPILGCPPCLTERRFYVVIDIPLMAGTIVNGRPVPAGAFLKAHPLQVLHSHGQLKKALKRIRRNRPAAYGLEMRSDKDAGPGTPRRLVLPGSGVAMKGGAA